MGPRFGGGLYQLYSGLYRDSELGAHCKELQDLL